MASQQVADNFKRISTQFLERSKFFKEHYFTRDQTEIIKNHELIALRIDYVNQLLSKISDYELTRICEEVSRILTDLKGQKGGSLSSLNLEKYDKALSAFFANTNSLVESFKKYESTNFENEAVSQFLEELKGSAGLSITNTINNLKTQEALFQAESIRHLQEVEKYKGDIKNASDTVSQIKNTVEAELNTLREKYKNDLTQYEVISQTVTFDNAAMISNSEGKSWRNYILGTTGLLLLVCIVFISTDWFEVEKLVSTIVDNKSVPKRAIETVIYYELIKRVLLRLLIISIILYFLKFAIKNYNALQHNKTINLHKANCFNAAVRIMNSMPEDKSREALLGNAGNEIFTQHRTGYLGKEESNIDINTLKELSDLLNKK